MISLVDTPFLVRMVPTMIFPELMPLFHKSRVGPLLSVAVCLSSKSGSFAPSPDAISTVKPLPSR